MAKIPAGLMRVDEQDQMELARHGDSVFSNFNFRMIRITLPTEVANCQPGRLRESRNPAGASVVQGRRRSREVPADDVVNLARSLYFFAYQSAFTGV